MAQRRQKASSKLRSRSPRQTVENPRLALKREREQRKEALERERATSEILRVIAESRTDIQPVFDTIVRNAVKLCGGRFSNAYSYDGEQLHLVATGQKSVEALKALAERYPMRPHERQASGRAILAKATVRIEDALADPEYDRRIALTGSYRRVLAVPMMRSGEPIGVITVSWAKPGPISTSQEQLLKTFADQAVIAIENVRLFNETKEALEQQTASSEVLGVISSSPTDLRPVFDAILASATRLCEAHLSLLNLYDGEKYRTVAQQGGTPEFARWAFERGAWKPAPVTTLGRMTAARQPIHVDDVKESPAYLAGVEIAVKFVELGGARTYLAVPLLKDGKVLGAISIYRPEVRPFTGKQIELVKTFANQAVIAIENARLFNELQTTNATLREALERQTATAEILNVISRSTTDVQPVFDTIIRNAVRLCDGAFGTLFRFDGKLMHVAAQQGHSVETEAFYRRDYPRPAARDAPSAHAILDGIAVNVSDIEQTDYAEEVKQRARVLGYRGLLSVPMTKDGTPIGAIAVLRRGVGAFADSHVALLKTFADQAVIAIENVRLFKELQERTEALTKSVGQLTALGEVGQAISSTLDLETVLKTIVSRAVQLTGLDAGGIYEYDEASEQFNLRAAENMPEEMVEVVRSKPIRKGEGAVGDTAVAREPIQVPDTQDESYKGRLRDLVIRIGRRALLAVPLVHEDHIVGALSVHRNTPGPFAPEVVELLKTFASQSALAIQNARLFNETNEALDQQKAMAEVLAVISSSIADTTPVFEKILESCQRVFAGRNVGINVVGDDGKVHSGAYRGHGRAELESHYPVPLSMESGSGAAIVSRQVVHYPDCDAPEVPEYARRGSRIAGNKSVLFAPMLWEGKAVGAIFVGRPVTGPFSDKEIALLRTFADQAVIAIQNAKLFREIQEKSAQLEVANKHKSDFLANMSHELRTPLNAIIGFSEALMDRMFGDLNEKQLEYQKDIHESGKHLLSLINDILDLSKIEAGRMELELSSFHLPTAISNAVTLIRERAMRHGIALGVEIDERLGDFQADERKLKQVLLNLLSNAVKFTPDGGRVDVSAKLDTDKVEISVKDTGVGISPEDQASLFEEFKQFGKDRSRKAEGTGLGLSLTKRLVELHGGQILVESMVGHGSTFRVMLPVQHERVGG